MISGPRGPVRTAPEEARCLAQSDGIEDGLEGGQVRQQEELAEQAALTSVYLNFGHDRDLALLCRNPFSLRGRRAGELGMMLLPSVPSLVIDVAAIPEHVH